MKPDGNDARRPILPAIGQPGWNGGVEQLLGKWVPRDAQRDFITEQEERETGGRQKKCVSLKGNDVIDLFPDKENTHSV